jgi:hypothetical protein
MTRELFAGRYEMLHEAPSGAAGRLFEARDTQTGNIVAVKVFHRQLDAGAPEREDLEKLFAAAHSCTHPKLVRYFALALDDGYLVREWVHGFSFVDLLRRRRELPAQELIVLLSGLAEGIDECVAAGAPPTGELLTRSFIAWDRSLAYENLVRLRAEPVTGWSGFNVKLNPLTLRHILSDGTETQQTIVGGGAMMGPILAPPVAFAEFIYDLLGAPRRTGFKRRYVPLGALNEAGNAVLRRIIEGHFQPPNCTSVWTELLQEADLRPPTVRPSPSSMANRAAPPMPTIAPARPSAPRAMPPPPPPKRSLQIPEPLLGSVQAGTILRLTPRDLTYTPIHLIARPVFRIGRSLYHADFIARVLPETEENEKVTKEIGRVHTIAELRDNRLVMRDGNGEQASVNGSTLDGQPLAHDRPTPLERSSVLGLYRNYQLDVTPLLGAYDRGIEIENEAAWPGPNEPAPSVSGGVVFMPKGGQQPLRKAAWIFTRLDFSISPRGDLAWCEAGTAGSQATILHYRGAFWIGNFSLPSGDLVVSEIDLPKGTIAPLVAGQALQLGPGNYITEIQ